jgi:hypothetical protein
MFILRSDQYLRTNVIKIDAIKLNIFKRDVYFTIRSRHENYYDRN